MCQAEGCLPGFLRFHTFGAGHPEVGGQAEGFAGEQVDVLAHLAVGGLDGEFVGSHEAQAKAGLQGGVVDVVDLKERSMQAEVGRKALPVEVVFEISVVFERVQILGAEQGVELRLFKFRIDGQRPRAIRMANGRSSKANEVVGQGQVVEIHLGGKILYARYVFCRKGRSFTQAGIGFLEF